MCSKHLSGEHLEAHMFVTKMLKGFSLKGYIEKSEFFGAGYVYTRHNELTLYLPGHSTPMELDGKLVSAYPDIRRTQDHINKSISDLLTRCVACRLKHAEFFRNQAKLLQKT